MDEVLEFLMNNPTYYLATVDDQGNPQVRPFGTIAAIDGDLCIQTGMVKDCYKQMEAHPRVAICAYDAEAGSWLRINADAVPDASTQTCEAMLADHPELQGMYAPGDGNCVVMRLRNVEASISSFSAETRSFTF